MALRRWKPFLGTFAHIDATIEAAAGVSREAFRCGTDRLVRALCAAADDSASEQACALLDAAMAEALVTLRDAVRESAAKGALASGEVVPALGALVSHHASARVRGLARGVVRQWKEAVEAEAATAVAALRVLDGVSAEARSVQVQPPPAEPKKLDEIVTKKQAEIVPGKKSKTFLKKPAPIVGLCDAKAAKISSNPKKSVPVKADPALGCIRINVKALLCAEASASTEIPASPQRKKTLPTTIGGAGEKRMPMTAPPGIIAEENMKMTATKRKLHERYQEKEDAKRRRRIQVIQPPPPPQKTKSQMQGRATQPAMRASVRASCAGERHIGVGTSSHQLRV